MADKTLTSSPAATGWTGGQYSLVRYVLATFLAVYLLFLAAGLAGLVADAASPLAGSGVALSTDEASCPIVSWLEYMPTPFMLSSHTAMAVALACIGAVMSFFVAAGNYDRAAALITAYVLLCFVAHKPVAIDPNWVLASVALVAHALMPSAPYGSIAARGRTDPAGQWRMPTWLYVAVWIVLSAFYFVDGYGKVSDAAWRDGSALSGGDTNLPNAVALCIAWGAMIVELGFGPLALFRLTRPWIWAAAMLQVSRFAFGGSPDALWGVLALHALTFDPAWIAGARQRGDDSGKQEYIFYDGHCGLCHRAVRFVLAEDTDGSLFRFAPLQGPAFEASIEAQTRETLPDSVIVRTHEGHLFVKSEATRYILSRLGGLWRIASWAMALIPVVIRNVVYDLIARVRRRLFKMPADACPMISAELRPRFEM